MPLGRTTDRPAHLAIVTANPLQLGGMQTFTRFLVETACAAGWQVTVALSGEDIYGRMDGRLSVERVDWVDETLAGDRPYDLPTILDRRRWFRLNRPDVALFVQSSNTPFRASVVGAALAGVPVVVTHRTMPWVRDFVPRGRHFFGLVPGLGLHNGRQILKTRLTAALARAIVYNSRFVRQEYEHLYGFPQSKGNVIVNAAPEAEGWTAPERPRSRVVVGYLGRLADEKRIDILIRALAVMRRRNEVQLVIWGDGPLRDLLAGLAGQLGVLDRVEFRGSTTDPAEAYAETDIVAVCSRRESSSNTVLEAMAAGKAVVVSNAGGLPELIDDGRAGVSLPVGDVEAVAAALDQLVADPAERLRLGRAAQAVARQRHDARLVARQWLGLLARAAGRRAVEDAARPAGSKRQPIASPG